MCNICIHYNQFNINLVRCIRMWRARCISTNVADAVTVTASVKCGRKVDPLTENIRQLSFKELLFAAENLAKTRVRDGNLWSRLCDRLKPELRSNDINDVLRVVHALAKVPYKKISFMNAVERMVLHRHGDLGPRAVTQYFIDATRLEHVEATTFQAVLRGRIVDFHNFSPFDLCFLVHVSAKLRLVDSVILDAVTAELLKTGNYDQLCKDKGLVAMLIRSLAVLQYNTRLFEQLVYSRLPSCIYKFSPQEICNVIFALVVAFQDQEYTVELKEIVGVLLDRVVTELDKLVDIEVNQLCISLFHLRCKLEPFHLNYQQLLNDIIRLDLEFQPSTSKMQYKIGPLLDSLKVQHKPEQRIGPYIMDYVLPQLKVAIEVNGYSHFYHQSRDFHAITLLKYKIVNSLGWKVLSVNYFDWKNRSRQSKLEYLASQLQDLIKN